MKRHIYSVYNIDTCNYSFPEEERRIYCPEIDYTHSGLPFYKIGATWIQYMKLRFRFWLMRKREGSRLKIKLIEK